MKKINDLRHYEDLFCNARQGRGRLFSNCCLLPDEISLLCKQNLLGYSMCGAGLLLFHTRGRDTRLMLAVDPGIPLDKKNFPKTDNPLVCDFPTSHDRYGSAAERLMEALSGMGFVHRATVRRMVFCPSPEQQAAICAVECSGLTIAPAHPNRAEEIAALWERTFDCVANTVPTLDELHLLLEQPGVLCASVGDNRLAGVLLTEIMAPIGWSRHLAVSLRGQGVGRALMTAWHRLGLEAGVNHFRLWVSELDTGAEVFHGKLGYALDGRTSRYFEM